MSATRVIVLVGLSFVDAAAFSLLNVWVPWGIGVGFLVVAGCLGIYDAGRRAVLRETEQ